MPPSLTPLQARVLVALSPLSPPAVLTGGGALAGVHLGHRTTRDLDLFLRDRAELRDAPADAARRLRDAGLSVDVIRDAPAFVQLDVADHGEHVVVDLVADPVPNIEPPSLHRIEGVEIAVDGLHDIFVNKLCTLLSRSELRDLIDVHALIGAGADLGRAAADAPRKDAGFSPITLAWVLERYPLGKLAAALGHDRETVAELDAFRRDLSVQLLDLVRPELA